jgi:hypothetical protein
MAGDMSPGAHLPKGESDVLDTDSPGATVTIPADAVGELRALASEGRLAETFARASVDQRRRLNGAAIAVASPVVFTRVTRIQEQRRGHSSCAAAVGRLADACLDRFYDDLEAVVEYLLTHATTPIRTVEPWIASRLQPATVDAHRRRRGGRGALQRPRLPGWLLKELAGDRWLGRLAIEILVWVGVAGTAGAGLWPLDGWADLRRQVTGDWNDSNPHTVERDVERVLSAMRTKPRWYADYVERPLGAKTPPVTSATDREVAGMEPSALALVEPHEADDARLTALAEQALEAIEGRLATDPDLNAAVTTVVRDVFGEIDVARELAGLPHDAPSADERIAALIDNSRDLKRIARVVRDILGGQVGYAGNA